MAQKIKVPKGEEVWTTRDGSKILVRDMTEEHAKNALRMAIRKIRADRPLVDAMKAVDEAVRVLEGRRREAWSRQSDAILDDVMNQDAMWGDD